MGKPEVDSFHLERSKGRLFIDAMTGNASVTAYAHQLLSDLDLIFRWLFLRWLGGREAVVLAEAVRHVFRMERECGHPHIEPRSWPGIDFAKERALDVVGVEHRAHVGERRARLDEALVGCGDVGDEVFRLDVGF